MPSIAPEGAEQSTLGQLDKLDSNPIPSTNQFKACGSQARRKRWAFPLPLRIPAKTELPHGDGRNAGTLGGGGHSGGDHHAALCRGPSRGPEVRPAGARYPAHAGGGEDVEALGVLWGRRHGAGELERTAAVEVARAALGA
jgi:hypothetical protein